MITEKLNIAEGEKVEDFEVRVVRSWPKPERPEDRRRVVACVDASEALLFVAMNHGGKADHLVVASPWARVTTYRVLEYKSDAPGNDYVKLDCTTLKFPATE